MAKKFEVEFDEYNFPDGPKQWPQWVVCWADKIPMYSPGFQRPLEKASPVDPSTWMPFETALHLCEMNDGLLPGFVLTADDPFTVIDLDVKDETPAENVTWFSQLAVGSGSFTEISSGGRGVHIWLHANLGEGRRSSSFGVERYSQERFIICTGSPLHANPIGSGNGVLEYLDPFLQEKTKVIHVVADGDQVQSDEEVIASIQDWDNAELFNTLYFLPLDHIQQRYGYPSGSEADAALVNFLVKASPNNAQVMRLFRATPLGNRGPKEGQKDKIMANDSYLMRTINNYRSILQTETDRKRAESEALIAMSSRNLAAMEMNIKGKESEIKQTLAVADSVYMNDKASFTFPHGIIGELAKWIYLNATYSVEPIAIVTALAACSGLTGKGWIFRRKFLSAYYIIAAPSGSGKNVIHTALGQLATVLCDQGMDGFKLYNMSNMRSEAAWRKELIQRENYLQVYAEIGDLFDKINHVSADTTMLKFILETYSSAHVGMRSGGMNYRNDEENVESKNTELTMTLLGECVIADLLKSLTGKLAEKGFISRFNFSVFDQDLPPRNMKAMNQDMAAMLPGWISEHICAIRSLGASLLTERKYIEVHCDNEETEAYLNSLEVIYRENANKVRNDETLNQIWNRCTERIERMVGTFAVMQNPSNPVVTMQDIEWCRTFVMSNVNYLLDKHREGQIGEVTDDKVRKSVAKAIIDYFGSDLSNHANDYKLEQHRQVGIMTLSPIQRRCYAQLKRLESSNIREKPTKALQRILQDFVSEGMIVPMSDLDKKTIKDTKSISIARNANAWMVADFDGINAIIK